MSVTHDPHDPKDALIPFREAIQTNTVIPKGIWSPLCLLISYKSSSLSMSGSALTKSNVLRILVLRKQDRRCATSLQYIDAQSVGTWVSRVLTPN